MDSRGEFSRLRGPPSPRWGPPDAAPAGRLPRSFPAGRPGAVPPGGLFPLRGRGGISTPPLPPPGAPNNRSSSG